MTKTVQVTVQISAEDHAAMLAGLRDDGTPILGRPLVAVLRLDRAVTVEPDWGGTCPTCGTTVARERVPVPSV